MKLTLFFQLALMLTIALSSCNKNEGPEYYDELDVTLTVYNPDFDFAPHSTIVINDTVALKHDYLSIAQVVDFYKDGGTSDKIIETYKAKFTTLGYTVLPVGDTTADLYLNPVVILSESHDVLYYPGYGWGGYYPGWGWGIGWDIYLSPQTPQQETARNQTKSTIGERSTDYYDYYYPGWGWGWGWGGYYVVSTYKTGVLTVEMAEGQSVREYWHFFEGKTEAEIEATPVDSVPKIKFVWKSFIEGYLSSDLKYDQERLNRGINESFSQSTYLNK